MKRMISFGLLALATVASACTTHDQNSYLVITMAPLVENTEKDTTKPPSCACAAEAATEPNFTPFGTALTSCLVLENRLQDNSVIGYRNNTNDFQLENVRVSYEVIGGGASIGEQVVPAAGLVAAGGKTALAVNMVPATIAPQIPVGTTVRLTMIGEGRLLDGSKVKTNAFEHLVKNTGANLTCN